MFGGLGEKLAKAHLIAGSRAPNFESLKEGIGNGGSSTVRFRVSPSILQCLQREKEYKPEVGDIVIGRVVEVAQKCWRLEINYNQDAVLLLSSMNMRDGV
ncbi:hypothetical protein JHK87_047636 [Glycine soja]|nr:hypothetical protein JHK87_047636 [Glycine soja]